MKKNYTPIIFTVLFVLTLNTFSFSIQGSKGCNTSSTHIEVACDSFISPSGKIWTGTGIYLDTIPNAAGCDSILFYNLIINQTKYHVKRAIKIISSRTLVNSWCSTS